MVARLLFSPAVMRSSLSGIDVRSPPALTEDYLSMDSSWTDIERLHAAGVIVNTPLGVGGINFFFTDLGDIPHVFVRRVDPSSKVVYDEWLWSHFGSYFIPTSGPFEGVSTYNTYYWVMAFSDHVLISPSQATTGGGGAAALPAGGDPDGRSTPWSWLVMVFRP